MAIVLTTVIIQLITIGSTSPTDFLLQILWQFVGDRHRRGGRKTLGLAI